MNYGLALFAEYHEMKDKHAISLGCEFLSLGMVSHDTSTKKVIGEYWFDTDKDRQTCVAYCDAMCKTMQALYLNSPDGTEMTFGGVA